MALEVKRCILIIQISFIMDFSVHYNFCYKVCRIIIPINVWIISQSLCTTEYNFVLTYFIMILEPSSNTMKTLDFKFIYTGHNVWIRIITKLKSWQKYKYIHDSSQCLNIYQWILKIMFKFNLQILTYKYHKPKILHLWQKIIIRTEQGYPKMQEQ